MRARFEGALCRHGHGTTRYVSGGKCCECIKIRGRGQMRKSRKTLEGRARLLLGGAQRRAKKQGVSCTITYRWVLNQLRSGRCAVSGLPFDLTSGQGRWKKLPFTPSLDRITARGDYSEANCRVVVLIVNEALGQWGMEPLLTLARSLSK